MSCAVMKEIVVVRFWYFKISFLVMSSLVIAVVNDNQRVIGHTYLIRHFAANGLWEYSRGRNIDKIKKFK